MRSSFWNYLTAPSLPNTALAVTPGYIALVELQKRGGGFSPRKVGLEDLPAGVIQPSLTEPNILNEGQFIEQLRSAAEKAGFSRKLSLSVSLPEGSIRSVVVTLENKPKGREELNQMLEWKASRAFNLRPAESRIRHRELSSEGPDPRYIVSAVSEAVASQYERVLRELGWHAGALLPQHLAEAQWLMRSHPEANEDQALVSVNESGFVAVVVRDRQPLLVRDVTCAPDECEDELFRVMTFYRDRLSGTHKIKTVLIVGEPAEQAAMSKAVTTALEYIPQKLLPGSVGLNLDSSAPFMHLAAATGLASLAY